MVDMSILADRLKRDRRQKASEALHQGRRKGERRKTIRNAKMNDWERRFHQRRGTLQI